MKVNNLIKIFGILSVTASFCMKGTNRYFEGVFDKQIELMNEMRETQKKLWEESERVWKDFDFTAMPPKGEVILDTEAVELPAIEVKAEKDKKSFKFIIKDLKIKKEDLKIDYHPKSEFILVKFPFAETTVSLKIYSHGYQIEGEKKITQEKKDKKGKVLGSSSYTGYNQIFKSFPFSINLDSIQEKSPSIKNDNLVFEFKPLKPEEPVISINIAEGGEEIEPKTEAKAVEQPKAEAKK